MSGSCKAITKSGKPCRAAGGTSGLCPFHGNPGRAAELGQKGGRRNRRFDAPPDDGPLEVPQTAKDVRQVLSEAMAEVRAKRLEPKVGTTLGYLGMALLKAIEVSDLESRLERLEGVVANVQNRS